MCRSCCPPENYSRTNPSEAATTMWWQFLFEKNKMRFLKSGSYIDIWLFVQVICITQKLHLSQTTQCDKKVTDKCKHLWKLSKHSVIAELGGTYGLHSRQQMWPKLCTHIYTWRHWQAKHANVSIIVHQLYKNGFMDYKHATRTSEDSCFCANRACWDISSGLCRLHPRPLSGWSA